MLAELEQQRVKGSGRLAVKRLGGRTRVARLYQEGAAKLRLPRRRSDPLEAVLINTAGGMTGGDRLDWRFEIGAGCKATLTTQACEKVYRASEDRAEISTRIDVGPGGRVAWLPQETIVFDRGALNRDLQVELAQDAEALIVEPVLFGRLAMGETVKRATFRDRWRVRREGWLIHAEDLALGPALSQQLEHAAIAGGAAAMATVLYVGAETEHHLERVRDLIGPAGGASAWYAGGSGKLLARILAADGKTLRNALVPVMHVLNTKAGLPKIWSV